MSRYKIPEIYLSGFKSLLSLDREKYDKVIEIIKNKIEIESLPGKIGEVISSEIEIDSKKAFEIANALFGLNGLFEVDESKSKEDVMKSFCDSIKFEFAEDEELIEKIDLEKISKDFIELTTDTPISISYKTLGLNSEYERVYKNSRILTDIRPVFKNDVEEDVHCAIIVHKLKVEYLDSRRESTTCYISLDSMDMQQLKKNIERAESKEKALKHTFNDKLKFIDTSKF